MFLCFLISPFYAISAPQSGGQSAGEITALIPAATRNDQPTKVNDGLQWNDLLQTKHSGRLRAGLTDGSILSLGTDSQLRVVQHDGASQQTSLEMNFGKVRSKVTKITQPGGKFEMKTPNAVIGVIGTDFITLVRPNRTTVICVDGQVNVTPSSGTQATSNTGQSNGNTIQLTAGQMVVITPRIPVGGFHALETPPALQQSSMLATDLNDNTPYSPGRGGGHGLRNGIIASALGAGLITGLAFGVAANTKCTTVGTSPGGGTTSPGGPTKGTCQ
jgi:hypothetical protein